MLLTRFFLPVLKENPKEAEIISHINMLRAGMIQQSASGIYSWLPLGKIVLEKISEICRQEMIKSGAKLTGDIILQHAGPDRWIDGHSCCRQPYTECADRPGIRRRIWTLFRNRLCGPRSRTRRHDCLRFVAFSWQGRRPEMVWRQI